MFRTFLLQRGALSLEGLLEFGRDGMLCFGAQIRGAVLCRQFSLEGLS